MGFTSKRILGSIFEEALGNNEKRPLRPENNVICAFS
jgi:hypothetical protein